MEPAADHEQAEREWRTAPGVISAGGWFSLIIAQDGRTYSLGDNLSGQCGGEKTEHTTPMIIAGLPRHQVRTVSAGLQHSMFVLANGDVLACGSNEYGQLGLSDVEETTVPKKLGAFVGARGLTPIKRAAAGGYHTLFLGFDGSVWSAGCNEHGQLGQGPIATYSPAPAIVSMTDRVKSIDAGPHSSAAVTESGGLFMWGDPVEGQIANNGLSQGNDPLFHHFQPVARNWNQSVPLRVIMIGQTVSQVSVGGTMQSSKGAGHVAVIADHGSTWSFGLNRNGQLGRTTPEIDYGGISPRSPK